MYDRIASGQPNKDKISERRYGAEKPENALDNDVQVFYRYYTCNFVAWNSSRFLQINLYRHGERPSKMPRVKSYTRKTVL